MNTFAHDVRGEEGRDYVKVVFPVRGNPSVTSESLWAERLANGRYRVANVPGWIEGLSLGDEIEGTIKNGSVQYVRVVRRGGHSTYRLAAQDPSDRTAFDLFWRSVSELGCERERLTNRLYAVDVLPTADIHLVYERLMTGMDAGAWWFDELHCGHQVNRP